VIPLAMMGTPWGKKGTAEYNPVLHWRKIDAPIPGWAGLSKEVKEMCPLFDHRNHMNQNSLTIVAVMGYMALLLDMFATFC
jgi:hypothetical protein